MTHSTRGAARVSIMWMISVGVVALMSLGFAFVVDGDLADAENARDAAQTELVAAKASESQAVDDRRLVSGNYGFTGGALDAFSNVTAADQLKAELRATFPDLDAQMVTIEDMGPVMMNQYRAAVNEATQAKTATVAAQTSKDAAKASWDKIDGDRTAQMRDERSSWTDEKSGYDDREADLARQVEKHIARVKELEQENNTIKQQLREDKRDAIDVIQTLSTKNELLSDLTRPMRAPANLNPDGQILEVSKDLPLAWIDLGSDNRLVLGTRFKVESGNLGDLSTKAWAEVVEVNADMAKVRIFDQVDKFDPVVKGDYLSNPVYDPKGGFNAILVGRFSGLYGKDELTVLLENIGIHVQEGLDLSTNFLIAGAPIMQDADGFALDEPLEASDLPVYQEAQSQKVQIITLAQIQDFFSF
jgi:hypothetical protein